MRRWCFDISFATGSTMPLGIEFGKPSRKRLASNSLQRTRLLLVPLLRRPMKGRNARQTLGSFSHWAWSRAAWRICSAVF